MISSSDQYLTVPALDFISAVQRATAIRHGGMLLPALGSRYHTADGHERMKMICTTAFAVTGFGLAPRKARGGLAGSRTGSTVVVQRGKGRAWHDDDDDLEKSSRDIDWSMQTKGYH